MTKTNKDKLVNWDADFYNSLSDEPCLYCLTPRQIYILGQALQQVHWSTRWFGDSGTLDLSAIAGEIEETIAMPQCTALQTLILNMNNLTALVAQLQATIENGGTVPPEYSETVDTPYYDYTGQNTPIGGITLACSEPGDRDKVYGGVHEFVEYCCEQFTDFLQITRATGSAIPEKVDQIISAIPIYETLPIDEVFGFAAYVFEEVEEAWDALLTEDRKQAFKCKLFCAIVANDCEFTPELVLMVLSLEAPDTMGDILASSIRDVLSIIITGSPVGDEMFYSLIGSMLLVVLAGEQFVGATGFRPYEYRFLAGYNSPDSDWEIFCTDCPEIYWNVDYRFFSADDFDYVPVTGTFDSVFFNGEELDPDPDGLSVVTLTIEREYETPITGFLGIGVVYDAVRDCGITGITVATSLAGVSNFSKNSSPGTQGVPVYKVDSVANLASAITIDKIFITMTMRRCDGNPAVARIHGIRLFLDTDTNMKETMTYEAPVGSPPNGIINYMDLWRNWSVL